MTQTVIANQAPSARVDREIRQWIHDGKCAPGQRLASEMDLAASLAASRGTVRAVLLRLQAEGLIEALPGRGRKVRGRIVATTPFKTHGTVLMARTIVMLTHAPSLPPGHPEMQSGGRAELAVEAAIADAAQAVSMHLLAIHTPTLSEPEIKQVIVGRPLGVLAASAVADSDAGWKLLHRLATGGLRVVAAGNREASPPFDRVLRDHEEGAYLLACLLIERGCRRILEIGSAPDDLPWVARRTAGYKRALQEADITPLPRVHGIVVSRDGTRENFATRVRQFAGFLAEHLLAANPVDAVMAQNDWDASVVLGACRVLGKRPNQDVLVVGYDDWWNTPEREWEPARPLATVEKRNAALGEEMVRLLIARCEGQLPSEAQCRIIKPRLVIVPQPDQPTLAAASAGSAAGQ